MNYERGADMAENEIQREAENQIHLMESVRSDVRVVYEITESLLDAWPDNARNPVAENVTNFAYDNLLQADKLIGGARFILAIGVYPHYPPNSRHWRRLETRSDEQRDRLDHHLRYTCLRDPVHLQHRKDAALAVIEGMIEIYKSRDVLFYLMDKRQLTDAEIRLSDAIVELSMEFVETLANAVSDLTRLRDPVDPPIAKPSLLEA